MKILYLHQYFLFPEDTGGTRSYDLAKSFVSKGYEVEIITSSGFIKSLDLQDKWTLIEREGIKVHILKLDYSNDLSYFQRSLVFIKFLWLATFKALSIKCDVVLATSTPLTIGIPAIVKRWKHKTSFVFEARDVWPEAVIAIGAIKNKLMQKVLYKLEKTIYKNASVIVPLSVDMKKSIVTRYPAFSSKVEYVIPNISEINRFSNTKDSIDLESIVGFKPRFTVLYAGTFGKVNGIDKFVELAKLTLKKDPQLVYILIGSGAEKQSVIELAKQSEVLDKNVFILDPIMKSELPAWYTSISMGSSFVIDIEELWANSANKFFDTLAAAKPVLINHEGWQAESIRNHNIGYVLPYTITDKIAKDFVAYTKDSQLHNTQSINALNLAKKEYALDVAVEKYTKIFENIKLKNKK